MTLNIILLLLIINSIKHLVLKPRLDVFYCGIWGFSSTDASKWDNLARFKFSILGMENDTRGGDGTGIAYDMLVHKTIAPKKFDDWWRTKDVVPESLTHPVIMGHDRKASVGSLSFENTQPIVFEYSGKGNTVQGILAHNGTIYNYKSLYEKHKIEAHYEDVDIKTMSDSQVLCLLLEKLGWSVLSEYIGSAAFLYMTAKDPSAMYVYHGKSATRKHMGETEERPLHYAVEDDQMWFSSTKAALEKIIRNKSGIKEVPFNKVFRIEGVTMTEVYSVDRSETFQYEAIETYPSAYRTEYGSYKKEEKGTPTILGLAADTNYAPSDGFIYWEKGIAKFRLPDTRDRDRDPILNGQIRATRYGLLVIDEKIKNYATWPLFCLYFWRGNLCKGRSAYMNCLANEEAYTGTLSEADVFMINGCNFVYPFITPNDPNMAYSVSRSHQWEINKINVALYEHPFTGVITNPIARTKDFRFQDGKLISTSYNNTCYNLDDLEEFSDKFPEEFQQEIIEWRASLQTSVTKPAEKPKALPIYDKPTCPYCWGEGTLDGTEAACPICEGEGKLSEEHVHKIIKDTKDYSEYLNAKSEGMKIVRTIGDIVSSSIDLLEEPDLKDHSKDLIEKLKDIEEIISDNE